MLSADPVAAAAPSNDAFDQAIPLSVPTTQTTSTIDATVAETDPTSCGTEVGHTVWYTVTPAADELVALSTAGSDFDTVLAVYTGARGALELVGCNDDAAGATSQLVEPLRAGTTYYVMVGGSWSSRGNLTLTVEQALSGFVTFALDRFGTVDREFGYPLISGQFRCSDMAYRSVVSVVVSPYACATVVEYTTITLRV